MAEELAYVLINPYTIIKSRTGGVIARLLSRSGAELVGASMFAPSNELVEEYIDAIKESKEVKNPEVKDLIIEYLRENYAPDKRTGQRRRVMFLLFKGENAINRLWNEVVGHITKETIAGETVRDTYGDFIKWPDGTVRYFEPAVIIGTEPKTIEKELKVWAKYADTDSGLLKDVIKYLPGSNVQMTLVLIKPDCFQCPSSRPGNIIDMFSKTGLYIIAAKVLHLSINQAKEFYRPVKDVLRKKLKDGVRQKIVEALSGAFDFEISGDIIDTIADRLNELNAEHQFNSIIRFMTGLDPVKTSPDEYDKSGRVKCLALVYQGIDAINKIRAVLGATDPSRAAPSTVRREFGQDVLVNTAHASDSPENAEREMRIVGIEKNSIKEIIENYYR